MIKTYALRILAFIQPLPFSVDELSSRVYHFAETKKYIRTYSIYMLVEAGRIHLASSISYPHSRYSICFFYSFSQASIHRTLIHSNYIFICNRIPFNRIFIQRPFMVHTKTYASTKNPFISVCKFYSSIYIKKTKISGGPLLNGKRAIRSLPRSAGTKLRIQLTFSLQFFFLYLPIKLR